MQAIQTPLNPHLVTRIQAWLRTNESIEFRKILGALASIEEADAIAALKKSDGDDGYRQEACDRVRMAKNYEFLLEVLDAAAYGHSPSNPQAIFPYVTLTIEQDNATEGISALLEELNKPAQ